MALHRFTSTSRATLRPLGRTSERDYQRIYVYLNEHKPFGPKFAQLFAEPVYVRGGDSVDWYWGAEAVAGQLVPLTSLAEPDHERILAIVRDRLSVLREEAQRLQVRGDAMAGPLFMAASVPEPLADYVWWMPQPQDEDRGRPVLVAWGFANEDPRAVGSDIEATRPRLTVPPPPQTEPAGFTASTFSAAPTPVRSRWLLAGLLWLLFAAICLAIGHMLLRGCGIDVAHWGLPDSLGLSYCVQPQAQEPPPPDRARELAALVGELELAVSRREATCLAELRPPPRAPEVQPPVPPPEPRPTVPPLPQDRWKKGDLSLLEGCWSLGHESTSRHTFGDGRKETCKVPKAKICFGADGKGMHEFGSVCPTAGAYSCRAPVTASFDGNGNLLLQQPKVTCSDGETHWMITQVNCRRQGDNSALCRYFGDTGWGRWSDEFRRD